MSESEEKKANFGNPIVNLFITGLVFIFFTWLLRPYVPAQTDLMRLIGAAFAGTALTLTFYLSINMYRACVIDYKEQGKR